MTSLLSLTESCLLRFQVQIWDVSSSFELWGRRIWRSKESRERTDMRRSSEQGRIKSWVQRKEGYKWEFRARTEIKEISAKTDMKWSLEQERIWRGVQSKDVYKGEFRARTDMKCSLEQGVYKSEFRARTYMKGSSEQGQI